MLQISGSQYQDLSSRRCEQYLQELEERLQARDPALASTLDKARTRAVVSGAFEGARTHGFTNRGPIRLYLDLCIALGSGFATDPMYASWAPEALGRPDPATQSERAEALFERGCAAFDAINGPDGGWGKAALVALQRWAEGDLQVPKEGYLGAYIVHEMRVIHPQKAAHGGEAALRQLVVGAGKVCSAHQVDAARAIILISALRFAFGAECIRDPAYGWIGSTLEDPRVPDASQRFAHLERKALTWLKAVNARQNARLPPR